MARISTYGITAPPLVGDKVIGTDVNGTPTDATKNFTVESIAALAGTEELVTLQQVLNAGNTATESINLTGNIALTGTLSANGGVGTTGQVLSSQGIGSPAQWVNIASLNPDIEQVLTVGNTATTEIILNGNATFNSTITAGGGGGAGTAGQLLSSTVTGVEWIDSSSFTPDLQAVLTAGSGSTLDINLGGTAIITSYGITLGVAGITLTGIFSANGSEGVAGQVLTSQGAGLSPQWAAAGGATPDLLAVLTAGDIALNGDITLSGTGSITIGTGASSFAGAVGINGGMRINSALRDTANSAGTAGQVLSSTVTGVAWAAAGGGTTLSTTTSISSAEILALNTTPKAIVAGVAAKHIVPIKIVAKYTFVTTAYTTINLGLIYLGAAANASTSYLFSDDVITGVASGTFLNSTDNVASNQTPKYNTAGGGDDLLFGWRNADPTLGDSTLEMTVIYSLVDA
jgi:hypothetical protein